eukprot:gnl/TRDRNA2_/TRDRNA2_126980_c0_seq1.p1 gnl/TRDRNA2_/TRDRNA2_126980_c0~~gnl/TRDRNA2_/TRDRNA2_126980_c0_seq1.p1  ORF type:complete len:317 (+),score=24.39 gnl/TRDRNA2_/TRDRNA2_126980_c0_seq1:142-951(+)
MADVRQSEAAPITRELDASSELRTSHVVAVNHLLHANATGVDKRSELNFWSWLSDALKQLAQVIGTAAEGHEWQDVRNRIREILARPTCPLCRQDLEDSGLFRAFSDLLEYWDGPRYKWVEAHKNINIALRKRLEPPTATHKLPLDSVRYTHDDISKSFRHGEHANRKVSGVCQDLLKSRATPNDEAMVLDVVFYHGHYRSLNNRHLDAQKQAQECLPKWIQAEHPAWVRIWPLTRGMKIHGKDVVDKFYEANSSRNDGRSVSRGRRGR